MAVGSLASVVGWKAIETPVAKALSKLRNPISYREREIIQEAEEKFVIGCYQWECA
ncbi:MAG: hypothetical protein F6K21_12810 [Symploca sp. SIO2D2]|nr:hypothetical protein [Symploca sp. SIO2D2]